MPPRLDWRLVAWGRPDSPPRPFCAYGPCCAYLPKDEIHLTLWKDDGSSASFCEKHAEAIIAERYPKR